MSVSRYRHTQLSVSKVDKHFLSVSSSQALWAGSNTIACNESFVAVPWSHLGSTAVFTHDAYGRIGANVPVLVGQEGAVINVQFDPFDKQKLFTASEDGTIMGWALPENGLTDNCSTPRLHIKAHDKKCGTIAFHPSASGVLASAGLDKTVKLWDVNHEEARMTLSNFDDYPTDVSWNLDGSEICAVSRDRNLSVFDARDGAAVASGVCHDSTRALRCVWAKRKDQIITFGWDSSQRRQFKVWDTRKLTRAVSTTTVDQGSGAMMPAYDEDLSLLYVGYKGEGSIRAYELMEGSLVLSFEHLSSESLKGMCMLPKHSLNVRQCEIGRLYELTQHSLFTMHMHLPRKMCETEFQRDVYPPTFAHKPALSADGFFGNAPLSPPLECDLEYLFDGSECVVLRRKTVGAELGTSDVKALKKPARKEGSVAPLHADPSANMVLETAERPNQHLDALLAQLAKQQEELSELRKQIGQKEAALLDTLAEIRQQLTK